MSAARTFEFPFQVGFGHCDPAGIVYFPRLFDVFHQTMEAWFGHLGFPYAPLIMKTRVGFPAVHSEADFRRPCVFGDDLVVCLSVGKLGATSLTLDYRVHGRGDPEDLRLTGRTVCAVMDLDPGSEHFRRAVGLPGPLRDAVEAFAGLDGTPAPGSGS